MSRTLTKNFIQHSVLMNIQQQTFNTYMSGEARVYLVYTKEKSNAMPRPSSIELAISQKRGDSYTVTTTPIEDDVPASTQALNDASDPANGNGGTGLVTHRQCS